VALVESGLRVIKYDRRGFGKSSKPWIGYDYDTLTDDLKAVLDALNLENVTLAGFSMGGGEAVRYFSRHAGNRVSKLVLLGSVTPYLLKTKEHPDGVDKSVFDEMIYNIKKDRIDFLDTFGKQFFGVNLISNPLSKPLLEYYRMLGSFASPLATLECIRSFSETDFRNDLKEIQVPTVVIHGGDDKIVPIEYSSDLTLKHVPHAQFITYEGAPHGFFYTEREQLNKDLINFIGHRGIESSIENILSHTI
jgi:non-heme chloroperoxidase